MPPLRPADSKIPPEDWKVLTRFWYPVAVTSEVTDAPFKAKLLDVHLVLFRSGETITAALDMCPHRWIRLSVGKVVDGNLVCAFHGLAFNASGQCVNVPALGKSTKIPASYRVRTFRARVQNGMVWVCLDDTSTEPIPIFPCLSGLDESQFGFTPIWIWPMSAARQIENFVDLAHLPFVHASTLGGDPQARLNPPQIEQRECSLVFRTRYVETVGFQKPTEFDFTYEVFLPFAIEFTTKSADGGGFRAVNIASPTSAHTCRVFQPTPGMKSPEDMPSTPLLGPYPGSDSGPGRINRQDIDILEHLAIADMPLNEKLEIHLPVDNVCGAYRKRLRELGLGNH